jgi:hypothetical protein
MVSSVAAWQRTISSCQTRTIGGRWLDRGQLHLQPTPIGPDIDRDQTGIRTLALMRVLYSNSSRTTFIAGDDK